MNLKHQQLMEKVKHIVTNSKLARFQGLVSPRRLKLRVIKGVAPFDTMSPDERRRFVFSPIKYPFKKGTSSNCRYLSPKRLGETVKSSRSPVHSPNDTFFEEDTIKSLF